MCIYVYLAPQFLGFNYVLVLFKAQAGIVIIVVNFMFVDPSSTLTFFPIISESPK